jgi:hypothetical protein
VVGIERRTLVGVETETKCTWPTPTASPEPELPDAQRVPGRIIGNAYPLRDFHQNLKQGDVVTKAVEDLEVVVREIVGQPFASRRKHEMVECLKELRETCLRMNACLALCMARNRLIDPVMRRRTR